MLWYFLEPDDSTGFPAPKSYGKTHYDMATGFPWRLRTKAVRTKRSTDRTRALIVKGIHGIP